jgi:2-phosphosulfolactate phosphatase
MTGPRLEVCFSPALLHAVRQGTDRNVVVVDILRATTAMCTAFGFGVGSVIPVAGVDEALAKKEQGWLVAGERDGQKLDFADFGNSPVEFRNQSIRGKEIVYCTTNGTRAILDGKRFGRVHIASFINLDTICGHLNRERNDVLIICAGWKDSFSLEDSIFAGAMSDLLVNAFGFLPEGDSVLASMTLWNQAVRSLHKTISQSDHYLRLLGIENRKTLKYCIFPEKFPVVPVLEGEKLVDLRFSV